MENRRYDFRPAPERERIKWPNDAKLAFWICPNIEYFHVDIPLRTSSSKHVPDVPGYALRDYGSRVGVYRMMDVLDKHDLRASVLLNTDVCKYQPAIIKAGVERQWEWLGHGFTNNHNLPGYAEEEQRGVVEEIKQIITTSTGKPPKGWLGPGLGEMFSTPDHLAAAGYEYVCDWCVDDQPVPMRVKCGRMLSIPYGQGVNDMRMFGEADFTPEQYYRMICDQFDVLYEESQSGGKVMSLPLHPYIIGIPFRIKYLDKVLAYIRSHKDVWCATSGEIADWYYQHYYKDPGKYSD
jgi:peptidoglycan/xylan/chitin deacetylase (PgdA/CDA1 family)